MSTQIPGLFIMHTEHKGRAVYTSIEIEMGDIIESAPVIVLSEEDRLTIHNTALHDYYFLWQENENGSSPKKCAIALGFGSLYNHSDKPNAEFIIDYENLSIDFIALQTILPGQEITINYRSEELEDFPLWFDVLD